MCLKLISCEILFREMCSLAARSPHQIDVEFLPKGLHDIAGAGMCEQLQAAVDNTDGSYYDAIALGYALCGMGLAGLTARSIPVVFPRGHDCITLFFGSRKRYQEYFQGNPGVYFKTTGWVERGTDLRQPGSNSLDKRFGVARTYEEMVATYGEDNGKYLWEQLGGYTQNYGKLTFIEMGIEPDDRFERLTREEAAQQGMQFEKVKGDIRLLQRLVNADWDEEDFLIVEPGHRVVAPLDGGIVAAEKVP